ncbi:MAG: hypothetical protein NWE85_03290 [Candidatus Bathyarchaeota archaeon]|nr:hypothetical protein [Candidatus Bathyarchaeota archaeon]
MANFYRYASRHQIQDEGRLTPAGADRAVGCRNRSWLRYCSWSLSEVGFAKPLGSSAIPLEEN